MTPFEYVEGVRRRLAVVLACVLIALAAGWVTTEAKPPAQDASRPALWSATSIIIGSGDAPPGLGSLITLAALTKVGEVPARVADALGREETGPLTGAISAVADPETALLTISSRAASRKEAESLANEFARQLVAFQRERSKEDGAPVFAPGAVRILQKAEAYPGEPILTASGSLLQTDDETARRRAQLYIVPADVDADDERVKALLEQGTSWTVPPRHPVRLGVSGGVGLVLGIAVALLLAHYDTRIRSKRVAEENVSSPVLSEIPKVKSRRARTADTFLSTAADSAPGYAFRLLVAALGAAPEAPLGRADADAGGRVILVTSPERADGKTTVAVNIAAGFAEAGRNVLLLSCDFRNPGIDKVLRVSGEGGLVQAIESAGPGPLLPSETKLVTSGNVTLRVVPTGKLPGKPARVLSSGGMRRALGEARATADVVVVDASPLTTTSDVAALIPYVDAILLVLQADKTTVERARAADELLHRLDAPVVGVVLNRVTRPASQRRGAPRTRRHPTPSEARNEGYPRLARHSNGT